MPIFYKPFSFYIKFEYLEKSLKFPFEAFYSNKAFCNFSAVLKKRSVNKSFECLGIEKEYDMNFQFMT